jgi:hypothetical protein
MKLYHIVLTMHYYVLADGPTEAGKIACQDRYAPADVACGEVCSEDTPEGGWDWSDYVYGVETSTQLRGVWPAKGGVDAL